MTAANLRMGSSGTPPAGRAGQAIGAAVGGFLLMWDLTNILTSPGSLKRRTGASVPLAYTKIIDNWCHAPGAAGAPPAIPMTGGILPRGRGFPFPGFFLGTGFPAYAARNPPLTSRFCPASIFRANEAIAASPYRQCLTG